MKAFSLQSMLVTASALALATATAPAAPFSTGFEAGEEQFVGQDGSVVTAVADPDNPGATPIEGVNAYFLGEDGVVNFPFTGDNRGTAEFFVYDLGKEAFPGQDEEGNASGPRWGLTAHGQSGDQVVGSSNEYRTYVAGDSNYSDGYGHDNNNPADGGTWFSVGFGSDRIKNTWNKWTIENATTSGPGEFNIIVTETGPGGTPDTENYTVEFGDLAPTSMDSTSDGAGGVNGLHFYGGEISTFTRDNGTPDDESDDVEITNDLANVYIDDITWTPVPEPASLAIFGVGGLLMLGRGRRQS